MTIKRYTPNGYFIPYGSLIGKTFDIDSEFSDSVLIRIDEQMVAVSIYDCVISLKANQSDG